MNKKIVASSLAAVMLLSAAPISSSAASQSTNSQDLQKYTVQETNIDNVNFKTSETTEFKTVEVQENGKESIVKFNKLTNEVTIDGEVIKDFNNSEMTQSQPRTLKGARKGPQYNPGGRTFKYVGTLSGSTKPVRDSVALTATAISLIVKVPAVRIISAMGGTYAALQDNYYYEYDLYQANPYTTDWWQYDVLRMYEDKARKIRMGGEMTGSPFKVDLPNRGHTTEKRKLYVKEFSYIFDR